MSPIGSATRAALERLIADDLRGATIVDVTVSAEGDGRIVIDEAILETDRGRRFSIGVGDVIITTGQTIYHAPGLILETYGHALGGWRPVRARVDYADELADLAAQHLEVDWDE